MNNKSKGFLGEEIANKYLRKKQIIILEKNFSCRIGEIDIIGLHNKTLIFYEVKTRGSDIYGTPSQAITRYKINKIRKTSLFYITRFNLFNYDVRYDVIEIFIGRNENLENINVIEDAF